MSTESQIPTGINGLLSYFSNSTHAGTALLVAAIADRQLEDALILKMRGLNNSMRERLFENYGPLSSFSAKIDIAYALCITDRITYDRLTIIRRVRNKFAHSDEPITFGNQDILAILSSIKENDDKELDPQMLFMSHALKIEQYLVKNVGPTILRPTTPLKGGG
jgi:DNA-binding MltR family transcriptional regulator